MDKIKIRQATRKDIKTIVRIFREEFSKKPYKDLWTEKNALKSISDYFKENNYIYLAEINNEVAGFVIFGLYQWTRNIEGFIDQIVVSENFQGIGIGKALMKLAEDYFKKKGIKEVSLYTDRRAGSTKFYERIGYKQGHMIIYTKKI
jgi:ribosomal protein S18 acetylase RimI-like enzyme